MTLRSASKRVAQQAERITERLLSGRLAGPSSTNELQQAVSAIGRASYSALGTAVRQAARQGCTTHPVTELALVNALHRSQQLRRGFAAGSGKKGWGNFVPREGKNPKKRPSGDKSEGASTANKSGPQTLGEAIQNPNLWGQVALLIAALALSSTSFSSRPEIVDIDFQQLRNELLAKDLVDRIEIVNKQLVKVFVRSEGAAASPSGSAPASTYKYRFQVGAPDAFERKLEDAQRSLGWAPEDFVPVTYSSQMGWASELARFAPTLLLIAVYVFVTRRMSGMGGMGGLGGSSGSGRNLFSVGKSGASLHDKSAKNQVMFKDVAGCEEAKVEILEFVNFLQNPQKYRDLGAVIPRGALLSGPPGTGKTLMAKATAGEAGVPFLSISGSEFMEMFVGVGPARVRDLFAQARAQAPSIIFIDEIDAIGRARGNGQSLGGGNDERENTLNQLLVEMDGFSSTSNVVVLGGTNRPEVLDKALLRPGRFDRAITIDRPDIKGREQIFQVHLGKITLDQPVTFYSQRLAALTPGFAGADIANVCNEAALIAARHDKSAVGMGDFEAAVDRVIGGLEKKHRTVSLVERTTVAYHEAGHAVAAWFLEHAEPLLKVSIVPRGSAALGFAQYLPNENLLMSTEQMADMMCMALGGRAAEQLLMGRITTGAQNDLERITTMAYQSVSVYGMSPAVGMVSFPSSLNPNALNKPFSQATGELIDGEVRSMIDTAYTRTLELLTEKKQLVTDLAEALMQREVLNSNDLEAILGPRPFESSVMRNIDKFQSGFGEEVPDAKLPGSELDSARKAAEVDGPSDHKSDEERGGEAEDEASAAVGKVVAT